MKGARLTEFGGGKNLSTFNGTSIKINPEMPECYRLRSWYDNEGDSIDAANLSSKSGSGNFNTPWMSFKEVQEQNLGNAERGNNETHLTKLMFSTLHSQVIVEEPIHGAIS